MSGEVADLAEEGLGLDDLAREAGGVRRAEQERRLGDVVDGLGLVLGEVEGAGALGAHGLRRGRFPR